MPNLYIFDLDGVLFDNSHLQHLLPTGDGQTAEQWDEFNLACENDEPIHHMWQMLRELWSSGHRIQFLTGRSEVCRVQTVNAILKALSLDGGPRWLFDSVDDFPTMRPVDDHRRAAEFKHDAIKHLADVTEATSGPMVELILVDDDPSIIEACAPLVDRTILVKPFSGCSALVKTSVKTDIENWDAAPITAATHVDIATCRLMWLDDGFTSPRQWRNEGWEKTYQPAPEQLAPVTQEFLRQTLSRLTWLR